MKKIVYIYGQWHEQTKLTTFNGIKCPPGLIELRPLKWHEVLLHKIKANLLTLTENCYKRAR